MKHGICQLAVAAVRAQPGDQLEMISQMVFGDVVEVMDRHKSWKLIKTVDDGYEGWVDEKQILNIDNDQYNGLVDDKRFYSLDSLTVCSPVNGPGRLILPLGARLPFYSNNQFRFIYTMYPFNGTVQDASQKPDRETISSIAELFFGIPYLWGGRSYFGIDCSGFTQQVFKMAGILLPRDAAQQVEHGQTVDFVHETLTGDLAFFDNDEGEIIHVGIVLDEEKIIHASGKVRIDTLDHQGIYNVHTRQYTHRLRMIKSLFH